ncbi:ATP-binding protein [Streptomyces sp. 8K308]|uniref:AAA family ATPase n=1 Tax=Streptomyces sp. 8K308 TaxID=2530388 RepID=UPI001049465C|nr:ATP-binding protein [Streptomyces sp. 8K308]TDC21065.1 ATP-binding protein [Streptomyces sp. 8K308]
MYLTHLRLKGVRGFYGPRVVDLDFARPDGSYAGWTVLAGRNGSGKTTLLRAIVLALGGINRADQLDEELNDWLSPGQDSGSASVGVLPDLTHDIGAIGSGRQDAVLVWHRTSEFHVMSLQPGELEPLSERSPKPGWFYAAYGPFRRLTGGEYTPGLANRLTAVRTLFHEDAALTEPVEQLIKEHYERLDGEREAAELLESALRLLSNGLLPDGCRVSRVSTKGLWVIHSEDEFPLRRMSDGFRAVVALVLDIMRHMQSAYGSLDLEERDGVPVLPKPGVVLIDEIDAHLHVSWQRRIGRWLKTHFPAIQFIVTTHSPYICQAADPNGLIRLPGPFDQEAPCVVDDELFGRVVYGSGDDAVVSELFGVDSPYSAGAEEMRSELAELELAVVTGQADEAQRRRFAELRDRLSSSQVARVDEMLRRLELSRERDS